MAGIKLQWAQFGEVDSFDVYRSTSPLDLSNLPPAIATDVTKHEYWDISVIRGTAYYYTVSSTINGVRYVSDEQVALTAINNDFIFVTSNIYIPPISPNIDFIWR